MILRVKFTKKDYLRYLSHLDLIRLFQRAFNRASIPVKFSEGFNPRPKFSIANPLPLGVSSEGEYMDIELFENISVERFIEDMNAILPKEIQIIKGILINKNEPAIDSLIEWAKYEIIFQVNEIINHEIFSNRIKEWLNKDKIIITKFRKRGKKKIAIEEDIISLIKNIDILEVENNNIVLNTIIKSGSNGNLRPLDFVESMGRDNSLEIDIDSIMLNRLELFVEDREMIYNPL